MLNNKLLAVSDARENMLKDIKCLSSEKCLIDRAHNRIISEDLYARISHPAEALSSMDGYAARVSDITKVPISLPQVGISAAGHAYKSTLLEGQLVRIFTGAVIPDGCDTIILQEDTQIVKDKIQINERPKLAQFIRKPGLDFLVGQKIISKSSLITARACALIALAGINEISVVRKPKIGVLTTGDELVEPGQMPKSGQLINSNNLLLRSLISACGAIPIDLGILPDKSGALIKKLETHTNLDFFVTTGGASVGDHDHIADDIKNSPDSSLHFWKIAMRPGKPLLFGKYKNIPLLGLPGNPVSAGVCSILFLVPIIKRFLGINTSVVFSEAYLMEDLAANDNREEYLRANIMIDEDKNVFVTPASKQDSSMLAVFNESNCLIQRPAYAPKIKKGSLVPILKFPYLF